MKIIGISGKKQSGKTTVVKYIGNKLCGHDEFSFAGFLKSIVLNLFCPIGWAHKDIDENKDFQLPTGRSVRQQLQWLGTDVLRNEYADCHINTFKAMYSRVKNDFDSAEHLLVSDVRFPNEVKCIQDLGGHVIRLLRNPHNDQHESETALDHMEKQGNATRKEIIARKNPLYALVWDSDNGFDAIIDNREMTIAEQNEAVWRLINQKGWL